MIPIPLSRPDITQREIDAVVDVLHTDTLSIGPKAVEFEKLCANLAGRRHGIAVSSGTAGLHCCLLALNIGPGDEVITPPNSFVASTAAIIAVGASPVFADVLPDQNIDPAAVEAAVTPRTKAIMPVHLTGRMADMNPLMAIADKHALAVIEDSAQAVGSTYDGRMSGTIGTFGCFSAHPLKNLNAAGDAGFLVTADAELAARIRRRRNHGLINRSDV